MTRDEAVERIQQGLSFRTDMSDEIKQRLEEARIDLETGKTLPWFLIEEDAVLTLAAGESTITYPTGFIRPVAEERLRYTPLDTQLPRNIPWKTLNEALAAYGDRDPGAPIVAILRNTGIQLLPAADTEYSVTLSYYKHSDALDGDDVATNAWLVNAPDALIGEAGRRMAEDISDAAATKKFEGMKMRGQQQLLAEGIERDAVQGPLILGANN